MAGNEQDESPLPGTGWAFPVRADYKGDIALSEGKDSVEDAIEVIIGTAKGERVMRPEFGCDIHEYVFDSVDGATMALAEESVREALIEWEPRIDLESVEAERDPENPNRLLIDIQYVIRSTNAEGNMVYPFYLTE